MILLALLGCIDKLQQVGGTGAIYTTACVADMEPTDQGYEASCTPPTCARGFTDAGISHHAAVLDPGKRLIGNAVRTCLQDLSLAARQFEAPDVQRLQPVE